MGVKNSCIPFLLKKAPWHLFKIGALFAWRTLNRRGRLLFLSTGSLIVEAEIVINKVAIATGSLCVPTI